MDLKIEKQRNFCKNIKLNNFASKIDCLTECFLSVCFAKSQLNFGGLFPLDFCVDFDIFKFLCEFV